MRKLTQLFLVAAALVATPAFADMKIAVMNYQMALLESDIPARKVAMHKSGFVLDPVHNLQVAFISGVTLEAPAGTESASSLA